MRKRMFKWQGQGFVYLALEGEAGNAVSDTRAKTFSGMARAATSSFIAPAHFESAADVALDLYAMSPPGGGAVRKVVEHEPQQTFIRYLTWSPMVFLAG